MSPSQAKEPLVSVIIPAYNAAEYILDALESVFSQHYNNIEVIVVNDGSTDTTRDLVSSYPKPIIFLDQENMGSAVARSKGIAAAHGKYIAFLDSDDLWLPGKLSSQVVFLEDNEEYGLVYSNWVTWKANDDGEFVEKDFVNQRDNIYLSQPLSGWLYEQLLNDCVVWTSSVLIRQQICQEVGDFDTSLRRGQDYDYWIRVSRITLMHKLDAIHAVYRIHKNSISSNIHDVNYEYCVLSKAIKEWGYSCPSGKKVNQQMVSKRLAQVSFEFGYRHFYEGDPNIGLRSMLVSIRHYPFNIKAWSYTILSFIKCVVSP